MGGGTPTYTQGNAWRFYADASPPSSPLADENAKPVLANNNIIRLRMQVTESAGTSGSGLWDIEYREGTGGTWTNMSAAGHFQMANGADTEGGTVSNLLSTSNFAGQFIESLTYSSSVQKSKINEFDLAIQPVAGNYTPSTDYYFRVIQIGSDAVGAPATYPVVTTPAAGGTDYPEYPGVGGLTIGQMAGKLGFGLYPPVSEDP